jgi:hypothetical protein
MEQDIIKILTKIFFDMGDIYRHIYSFYDKERLENDYVNIEKFIKLCEKNNILTNPCVLFSFLDTMNVKVAIMPVVNTNDWNFRIYSDTGIHISDTFTSRNEATLNGIETAFFTYYRKNLKTEKNGK